VDVPAPTTGPEFTPPSCAAAGSFVAPASTDGLEYTTTTENGVITISVVAKPGFVLSGETGPWTKAVSDLAQLTGEACDTEVDSAGPVPPTTPPAQAVRPEATPAQASAPGDPAPASLPATGSSSWALAGAALAALAAGLLLTRLSRRPDEQTA
jgi:LPXTG-motif cell wall-anchored protein